MRRLSFSVTTGAFAGAALVFLSLTVYAGSGARAPDRCMSKFFVSGGKWSWTHLATRCEYGLPTQVGYAYSWASFLLAVVIVAFVWTSVSRWMAQSVNQRQPGQGRAG